MSESGDGVLRTVPVLGPTAAPDEKKTLHYTALATAGPLTTTSGMSEPLIVSPSPGSSKSAAEALNRASSSTEPRSRKPNILSAPSISATKVVGVSSSGGPVFLMRPSDGMPHKVLLTALPGGGGAAKGGTEGGGGTVSGARLLLPRPPLTPGHTPPGGSPLQSPTPPTIKTVCRSFNMISTSIPHHATIALKSPDGMGKIIQPNIIRQRVDGRLGSSILVPGKTTSTAGSAGSTSSPPTLTLIRRPTTATLAAAASSTQDKTKKYLLLKEQLGNSRGSPGGQHPAQPPLSQPSPSEPRIPNLNPISKEIVTKKNEVSAVDKKSTSTELKALDDVATKQETGSKNDERLADKIFDDAAQALIDEVQANNSDKPSVSKSGGEKGPKKPLPALIPRESVKGSSVPVSKASTPPASKASTAPASKASIAPACKASNGSAPTTTTAPTPASSTSTATSASAPKAQVSATSASASTAPTPVSASASTAPTPVSASASTAPTPASASSVPASAPASGGSVAETPLSVSTTPALAARKPSTPASASSAPASGTIHRCSMSATPTSTTTMSAPATGTPSSSPAPSSTPTAPAQTAPTASAPAPPSGGGSRARKRKGNLGTTRLDLPTPAKVRAVTDNHDNLKLLPGAEEIDPFKAINWDDSGVGFLPQSDIQFVVNEVGMIELNASLKQLEKQRPGKVDNSEEIICCVQCRCYGLIVEFFNEYFCSLKCKEELLAEQNALVNLENIELISTEPSSLVGGGGAENSSQISGSEHSLNCNSHNLDAGALPIKNEPRPSIDMDSDEEDSNEEISTTTTTDEHDDSPSPPKNRPASVMPPPTKKVKKMLAPLSDYQRRTPPVGGSNSQKRLESSDKSVSPPPPESAAPASVKPKRTPRPSQAFLSSSPPAGSSSSSSSTAASQSDPFISSAISHKKLRPRMIEQMNKYCEQIIAQDLDVGFFTREKFEPIKAKTSFSWANYLTQCKASPVWVKLFNSPFPSRPNRFTVGQMLEAIDPEHQSYFCLVSVAQVKGYRMKMHFEGYPPQYDFWINANSPNIFEAGYCARHGIPLHPPPGISLRNFDWGQFLAKREAKAAPQSLFETRPHEANLFKVDMKLEAVDRKNTFLVCVATVAAVMGNRILVHFDSWGDLYDYWVETSSPYIRPVGWCQANRHLLTPPNGYKAETFSWKRYLRDTKSVAAPEKAFAVRPPIEFKEGMKLEAVDRRAPHLLRVATVSAVLPYQIQITFDGFPSHFGYWVDDDCPDIHPVGWASRAGHPLEPPPTAEDLAGSDCPSPGCMGDGHLKGTKLEHHTEPDVCPYAAKNLGKETALTDRLKFAHVKFKRYGNEFHPAPGDSEDESDNDEMENCSWLSIRQKTNKFSKRLTEEEYNATFLPGAKSSSTKETRQISTQTSPDSLPPQSASECPSDSLTDSEEINGIFGPASPIPFIHTDKEIRSIDKINYIGIKDSINNSCTSTKKDARVTSEHRENGIREEEGNALDVNIIVKEEPIDPEEDLGGGERKVESYDDNESNESLTPGTRVKVTPQLKATAKPSSGAPQDEGEEEGRQEIVEIKEEPNEEDEAEEGAEVSVKGTEVKDEEELEEINVLRWSINQVAQFTKPLIPNCSYDSFIKEGIDGAGLLMLEINDLRSYLGLSLPDAEHLFSKISSLREKVSKSLSNHHLCTY